LNGKSLSSNQKEIKEIKSYLIPFIDYIDLNQIDAKEIRDRVEPYIYSAKKVNDVYYFKTQNERIGFIRGVPIFRWKNDGFDKPLITSDNGFTIEVFMKLTELKSISGDLIFKGEGVYE
jgi:hypothetical protein